MPEPMLECNFGVTRRVHTGVGCPSRDCEEVPVQRTSGAFRECCRWSLRLIHVFVRHSAGAQ